MEMRISNLFNLLGNVIPYLRKQRSQTNLAIADDDSGGSVSAGIPSTFMPLPALPSDPPLAYAISARSEQGIQVSTPGASDMSQQALTRIQAITGLIPLAGSPMQAAISGLWTILQIIDRHKENKSGIAVLRGRLRRLCGYLYNAPTACDGFEQLQRDNLISVLLDTSRQLKFLDEGCLGYQSIAQAIAGCSGELDNYLAEFAFSAQMQTRSDVVEIREILVRHLAGSAVPDLPGTVTLGCLILVDMTGHEHNIPLKFCTSFQQLNKMLEVLFMDDSEEARIQAQYMKQGQYDLCVDQGTQVTELTCGLDGWPRIEAGMKIVMRVIVEKQLRLNPPIKCDVCGCSNVSVQSAGIKGRHSWTIFCRGCKRRYQITTPSASELTPNGTGVLTQVTNHQMIRNMHIRETFESERQSRRVSFEEFRLFSGVRDLLVLAAYTILTGLLPCPALRDPETKEPPPSNSPDSSKNSEKKKEPENSKEEPKNFPMPCHSGQQMSLRHCSHNLSLSTRYQLLQ